MIAPLRVLLPSDVFPPRCGGAGWSAHTLALALIERGHHVTAIVPRRTTNDARYGRPHRVEDVLGVPTIRLDYLAPCIPIVQNYFRYERFWPRFADALVTIAECRSPIADCEDQSLIFSHAFRKTVLALQSVLWGWGCGGRAAPRPHTPTPTRLSSCHGSCLNLQSTIIHAQHVQSAAPAVLASRRIGAPVVVTVRDHWPWDYFATGLHGDRLPYERQTAAALATDLVARLGPARGSLALPTIPYMLAHVRRRQRALRTADAVIAVSGYMAGRLAPLVAPQRIHVIPNMVDLAAIDAAVATPPASVAPGEPYLLFVGKLERNKGAHLLIDIFRALNSIETWGLGLGAWEDRKPQASSPKPQTNELVIAGNGPLRPEIERELAAIGVRARFLDWVDHDEVLRLMARCTLLVFPSAWGEPLSRVPLEASACGAPILAMPTGGTPDIIADGVNGALEATTVGFARRLAALLADPARRLALGAAARRVAEQRFAKDVVVRRVEALYESLLDRQ